MDANEKLLALFTTRVRQMILQYQELKKENDELYVMVDRKDAHIRQLESQLSQAQKDYSNLKIARMVEITDGDMESASKRLARLIREVNKCITLLSGK